MKRDGATSTVLADGRVLRAGGVLQCTPIGQPAFASRDVELLEPSTSN